LRELDRGKGPLGTFLFLGPSGVGKTEMARLMAEYFSGSQDALIKISCAGFSQAHMVHKILGAPPSYIGFDRKPLLSQEYINSIAIPETALVSTRSAESDVSDCNEKILDNINLLQAQIIDFEDRIDTNMSLINFLGSYNKLLNTGGAEIGEKPLREIFRDKGMETEMMSLLGKESARILNEDICTPLHNIVLILDLYAQTKGLIELTTGYSLTDKGKEGLVRWALARGKRTARGVAAITGLPLTEVSPILASLQH